jgi:hypothetical protein
MGEAPDLTGKENPILLGARTSKQLPRGPDVVGPVLL